MTAEPVADDGNLPAARQRLEDAVNALVEPQPQVVEGQMTWLDSLYVQLMEALERQGAAGSRVACSQLPISVDAFDLLNEINTAIAAWQPDPGIYDGDLSPENPPTPETIRRLHLIQARPWRPQDVRNIDQISGALEAWVRSIESLLTPPRKWTLPAACPACDTAVVYRRDSSGERVRQPALQIGPQGCFCANCHYTWGPERFMLLAKTLGYEMPQGVLE